ncbi:hypothetical protein COM81_26515, partial [Priestia megaterium]
MQGANLGDERVLRCEHLCRWITDGLFELEVRGYGDGSREVLDHFEVQRCCLPQEGKELWGVFSEVNLGRRRRSAGLEPRNFHAKCVSTEPGDHGFSLGRSGGR